MDKELKERCERITEFFDQLARHSEYGTFADECPISNFVDVYPELEKIGIDEHLQDDMADIFMDFRRVAFALGFVIGQKYEITYEEANEDVEAIEKVMREKHILPYLPREKERREQSK